MMEGHPRCESQGRRAVLEDIAASSEASWRPRRTATLGRPVRPSHRHHMRHVCMLFVVIMRDGDAVDCAVRVLVMPLQCCRSVGVGWLRVDGGLFGRCQESDCDAQKGHAQGGPDHSRRTLPPPKRRRHALSIVVCCDGIWKTMLHPASGKLSAHPDCNSILRHDL
jgi:hypothetical protein